MAKQLTKKYLANSPITEVVCELIFSIKNNLDKVEQDKRKAVFYGDIKNIFPTKKAGSMLNVEIKPGKEKNIEKRTYEFEQFFSQDEKSCVRFIGTNKISIHKFKPYESWIKFLPIIKLVVDSFIKNFEADSLSRIGLRYINKFEIPSTGDVIDLGHYFNLLPVFKTGHADVMASFFVGNVFEKDGGIDNLRVQLLDERVKDGKSFFIFDIDYYLVKPEEGRLGKVESWLNKAHQSIEEVFYSVLTERAQKLFD